MVGKRQRILSRKSSIFLSRCLTYIAYVCYIYSAMNEEHKTTENKDPIQLTPSAIEKVKNMMAKDGKEGSGLRVGVLTGGCAGLSYDLRFQKNSYDNDLIFEQGGIKIFMNPESVSALKGTVIDFVDTLKTSGFQYKNPNAQSSCGCGESFS